MGEKKNIRERYRSNSLYVVLHSPLWCRQTDDLSPEEVWIEANQLATLLRSENDTDNVKIWVQDSFSDLCERYSSFEQEDGEITKRTADQSKHSAMMVSLAAFLLLANVYPEASKHPYRSICQEIFGIISTIPDCLDLYEDIRKNEDEEEAQGKFIEVADFIEEIAIQDSAPTPSQKKKVQQFAAVIVEEVSKHGITIMIPFADLLSRANDKCDHCIQPQVDILRERIDEKRKGMPLTEQESEVIKQKRKALLENSIILNLEPRGNKIDVYNLYCFIETHFVNYISYKYQWAALRYFLLHYDLLKTSTVEEFAALMNRKEWFMHVEKTCEANEINTYYFLKGNSASQWMDCKIPAGSRATLKSISNIYKAYQELELYKDELGLVN